MNQEIPSPSTLGYLIVHVTTARGAIPLEGAQVTVRGYEAEFEEARGDVIATMVTDRGGNTPRLALPAPARTQSTAPGGKTPFAVYNLEVILEGYRRQFYYALPIFEGITAVQPVDMIPLSESGTQDPLRPEEDRFFESEAPNL